MGFMLTLQPDSWCCTKLHCTTLASALEAGFIHVVKHGGEFEIVSCSTGEVVAHHIEKLGTYIANSIVYAE